VNAPKQGSFKSRPSNRGRRGHDETAATIITFGTLRYKTVWVLVGALGPKERSSVGLGPPSFARTRRVPSRLVPRSDPARSGVRSDLLNSLVRPRFARTLARSLAVGGLRRSDRRNASTPSFDAREHSEGTGHAFDAHSFVAVAWWRARTRLVRLGPPTSPLAFARSFVLGSART
jgi:hypothetical protein